MFFLSQLDQNLLQNLWLILFHAVWQGALVGFVLWNLQKILRTKSLALRYGIFVTGLWVVLLLPVFTWFVTSGQHPQRSPETTSASISKAEKNSASQISINILDLPYVISNWNSVEPADPFDQRLQAHSRDQISPLLSQPTSDPIDAELAPLTNFRIYTKIIVLTWGLGVLLFSCRLFIGFLWIVSISASRSTLDVGISSRIESLTLSQKWIVTPRLFLSPKVSEAIVVGYLRPMVLIPLSWTTQLTPEALEAVIVHELMHIRRFDLWVILVQRIAETLLFFHPIVWWISKRISIEREHCCDAESVLFLDSNLSYAKALEQVALRLLEQSQTKTLSPRLFNSLLSLNFGGQKMELLARIEHVLQLSSQKRTTISRRPRHAAVMLIIPLMVIGIGFSLVQVFAAEPPLKNLSVEASLQSPQETQAEEPVKQNVEVTVEEIKEKSSTKSVILGVGVESDAEVAGELTLDESNFKKSFTTPLDRKKYQIHIKQENFAVIAKSMQIDSTSKSIRLKQGKLQIRSGESTANLLADQIELRFDVLADALSKTPNFIKATGHVKFSDGNGPNDAQTFMTCDEFAWDLDKNSIQMRGKSTTQDSLNTIPAPKESENKKDVTRNPDELNKLLEDCLKQPIDFTYIGVSLDQALVEIGKNQLKNCLVMDEISLRKAGISLQQELSLQVEGISLGSCLQLILEPYGASFYIDNGNFVVTSKLKATHHRVTRVHNLSRFLNHDGFYQAPRPFDDPKERLKPLIEFLRGESTPWELGKSTAQFKPKSQQLEIIAPQAQQDQTNQRLELLRKVLEGNPDTNFDHLVQKASSTFHNKNNVIEQSLLQLAKQQQILTHQEKIGQNLQQLISLDFEDRPFSELLQHIANHAGINIVIDDAALAEVGISSNEPITVHLDQVSVSTGLNVVLRSLDLSSMIEDEVLKIISSEQAEGEHLVVVYQVEDLTGDAIETNLEIVSLIELLQSVVAPHSWAISGGPGAITSHSATNCLVVRQVRAVHDEIEWLLQELRDARLGKKPESLTAKTPQRTAGVKNLNSSVQFELNNVTLLDALTQIRQQTGIQFYVDQQGLDEAGVSGQTIVTLKTSEAIMIKSGLSLLLTPLGLGYSEDDGLIVISSKQRCAEPHQVRLYSTEGKSFERSGLEEICNELKSKIAPESWDSHGGAGVATFDPESKTLIIRQSDDVHKQIAEYLK
ncbi:M56 family metallopeptidase [Thalassoglobus polymorphus]|uniref:Regulatory protein BlaR1 n=1 Tax=Thalassoglobus polymorphus TaxID=2527994 RepID=A0A517QN25_9PLAN|nr:M56 family metallopeptidase [Thalassoglobus polymorphus]QDT33039.1 Regulatory protein BlaR1 [Thalassoglobus polymorphus]